MIHRSAIKIYEFRSCRQTCVVVAVSTTLIVLLISSHKQSLNDSLLERHEDPLHFSTNEVHIPWAIIFPIPIADLVSLSGAAISSSSKGYAERKTFGIDREGP